LCLVQKWIEHAGVVQVHAATANRTRAQPSTPLRISEAGDPHLIALSRRLTTRLAARI
jgi:hypothetical protein